MERMPCEKAFSFAAESASGEISMALIDAWGSSVAKVIEIAPLPVPISKMEGDEQGEKILRATSTRVSVSGRGIITAGLTLNGKDQNSFLPIIYETGSPLIRRVIRF